MKHGNFVTRWMLVSALILLGMAAFPFHGQASAAAPAPTPTSWVIIDLPPDATQLQHGKEIYNLVCSACHAYDGTGLTDQWRATWDPSDQNCWKSKCHATNHPSDGFSMPMSPPVVGAFIPVRFKSAGVLHDFIQAAMPWQNPKSLTQDDAWAVTAYVMRLNGMSPPNPLNELNASALPISSNVSIDPALKLSIPPGSQKSAAAPAATLAASPSPSAVPGATAQVSAQKAQPGNGLTTPVLIGAGLLVIIALAILFFRKKR